MLLNNILLLQASANRPVGPGGTAKYEFMHMAKNVVHAGGVTRHNSKWYTASALHCSGPLSAALDICLQKARVVLAVLFPCAQPESRRSRLLFVGGSTRYIACGSETRSEMWSRIDVVTDDRRDPGLRL